MVLWLRIFTRILKQRWWHDVDCFKCNWLQWWVLFPKFQKVSYFLDILFPAARLDIINKFRFQCTIFSYASFKSFEYRSTDIVPKVAFVIPISVGVVAITFVISRCYVVTLISVLELMLFSLFLFLQKLKCCSIPLLQLDPQWHMLQLTYVHCSDFDFVGLKLLISLDYLPRQLAVWIKSFYFSFSLSVNV